MTFTITLNWLFAGNLLTFLFGLAFILFWLALLIENRYSTAIGDFVWGLLFIIGGTIVTITSAFNILQ